MNPEIYVPVFILLGIGIIFLLVLVIILSLIILRNRKFYSGFSLEKTYSALNEVKAEINSVSQNLQQSAKEDAYFRGQLSTQLVDITQVSRKLSEETATMNSALKGNNRTQGIWGEIVLDRVLEMSGLKENRDYKKQVTLNTEDGAKARPDVLVLLPQQRFIIIDAKVSLQAFSQFIAAQESGADCKKPLKEHLQSIRSHINSLSKKRYSTIHGAQSLDLTLMFLPAEHTLSFALDQDSSLLSYALENQIIPVTPTTLLLALQLVYQLWTQQEQDSKAKEILTLSRTLLNKTQEIWEQLSILQDRIESVGVQAQKINRMFTSPRVGLLRVLGQMQEYPEQPEDKNL